MQNIETIQNALCRLNIDAWLLVNFRHRNPFLDALADDDGTSVMTRRCAYVIPAVGRPQKLLHRIEAGQLATLPGDTRLFSGWREFEDGITTMLGDAKRVAMEYSLRMAIPTVAIADAGLVDIVRDLGKDVVSSADLIQEFEATWTDDEFATHERAAAALGECVDATFAEVARRVQSRETCDEYAIQEFMVRFLNDRGMMFDHAPIVAVNAHAADPHYAPTPETSLPIRDGDLLLIDLWCKEAGKSRAMYADITWTAFVGSGVPEKHAKVFRTVADARDAALQALVDASREGVALRGADVDDVCRDVIANAGYGESFTHRTGHSIGTNVHGNGANVDNLETRDDRLLLPRTCFSIEPGIYLPDEFGIRSEIDVYIHPDGRVAQTGRPRQTELIPLLR